MTIQNNNSEHSHRIGSLEVDVGVIGQKIDNTHRTLQDIKNSLEKQTELMGQVLLIQERQEVSKIELDAVRVTVGKLDEQVVELMSVSHSLGGWFKGVGGVVFILFGILSGIGHYYAGRIDEIEKSVFPTNASLLQTQPVRVEK